MTTALPQTVSLGVDQSRLLKEFGRFFTSFSAACTELIQNAYRADATEVHFTIDHLQRTIEVRDNGRGAPDPTTFVTVGQTGWDETRVIEPAGLGFFALLSVCQTLTIQSQPAGGPGWQLTIEADAWEGQEIPVAPYHQAAPGTTISGTLRDSVGSLHLADTVNHFFPVKVTVVDIMRHRRCDGQAPPSAVKREVRQLPIRQLPAGLYCSAGHFSRLTSRIWPTDRHRVRLVWEHRVIEHDDLHDDLHHALTALPDGGHVFDALATDRYQYLLELPADTQVRPVLPERGHVVKDRAYTEVVQQLAAALVEAFEADRLRAALRPLNLAPIQEHYSEFVSQDGTPVRLDDVQALVHPVFPRPSSQLLLKVAGYQEYDYEDYESYWVTRPYEENWELDLDRRHYWGVPQLRLHYRQRALAAALDRAQLPTCCVPDSEPGDQVVLHLEGYRAIPRLNLAIAERIWVTTQDGRFEQELDRLFFWSPPQLGEVLIDGLVAPDFPEQVAILRGTPDQLLARYQRELEPDVIGWFLAVVNRWGCYHTLDEFIDEAHETIDQAEVRRVFLEELVRELAPDRASALAQQHQLERFREQLADQEWIIEDLRSWARQLVTDCSDAAGLEELQAALTLASNAIKRYLDHPAVAA